MAGRFRSNRLDPRNRRPCPRRPNCRDRPQRFGLAMEHSTYREGISRHRALLSKSETTRLDAPLTRQEGHGASAIWLKQTIHPEGAPALTRISSRKAIRRRSARTGKSLRYLAGHSAPGEHPRSGCTWRILVTRLSGTRYQGLTNAYTSALSKPAGPMNWPTSSSYRGTRCIPRGCASTINSIGEARSRGIWQTGSKGPPHPFSHPESRPRRRTAQARHEGLPVSD